MHQFRTSTTPLQYTGRENDGATGLYYYRARYYSPQLDRFIAEDPIGLGGGTNYYAYADGDPLSAMDPLGLWSVSGSVYAGPGAAISFGRSHGCGFLTLRIGLGVGFGIGLDKEGSFPGIPSTPPGLYKFTIAATVKGALRSGPWGTEAEVGAARDYGTHESKPVFEASPATLQALWGVEAERSVGFSVTGYGGAKCGCSK
jgi:RHS repeat-associated protein